MTAFGPVGGRNRELEVRARARGPSSFPKSVILSLYTKRGAGLTRTNSVRRLKPEPPDGLPHESEPAREGRPAGGDLPAGKTCPDCVRAERCAAIFGRVAGDTVCGFRRNRFLPRDAAPR